MSDLVTTTVDAGVEIWAKRIRPHLVAAVEHIIAAGKELIGAKEALPHGEFGTLCESLGLTTRTAQRFMAIARHPVIANATHGSHLPTAWTTLFELSRMPGDDLEQALADGAVTAETSRREA